MIYVKKEVIIFDFDGTLIESVNIKDKAFKKIFSRFPEKERKKAWDFHKEHSGWSRVEKFKILLEGISEAQHKIKMEELSIEFSVLVTEEIVKAPLVENTLQVLRNAQSSYELFLVSITPQKELEYILDNLHLSSFFTAVYGGTCKKEDIIMNIINQHKLSRKNIVLIGDTLQDMEASQICKIRFLGRINQHVFPSNVFSSKSLLEIFNHLKGPHEDNLYDTRKNWKH